MPGAAPIHKRLTLEAVERLKAGDAPLRVYDATAPGLHVLVMPSGVKSWNLNYRTTAGRVRRIGIGRHPVVSPDAARKRARELLATVQAGGDPLRERERIRDAGTLRQAVAKYSEALRAGKVRAAGRGTKGARGEKRPLGARTIGMREIWLRHAVTVLGGRPLADIHSRDVDAMHTTIGDSLGRITANRVVASVSLLYRWAQLNDLVPADCDPTRSVPRFVESIRHNPPSEADYARIGAALTAYETKYPGAESAVACIRFLLLTGRRRDEARTLRWDDVDLSARTMSVGTKTGPATFSLPEPAMELLRVQATRMKPGNPYVFTSPRVSGIAVNDANKVWRVIRQTIGLGTVDAQGGKRVAMRLHDFRHGVGVTATGMGLNTATTAAILGHGSEVSTEVYNAPTHDTAAEAVEAVSRKIAAMMRAAVRPN